MFCNKPGCGKPVAKPHRVCIDCKAQRYRRYRNSQVQSVAHSEHYRMTRAANAEVPEYRALSTIDKNRLNSRLSQYGISTADYFTLLRAQEGKCAICQRCDGWHLHIDHCHETGEVRGLLCRRCNSGLGCFGDDLSLLLVAIGYLGGKQR